MSIKFLTAGTVLLMSVLLMGCMVSAQRAGLPAPRFSLDKLAGGDERVNGSGRIVTEDFDIRDFSRVDISHAFNVEVIQSGSYEVAVRIDENLQQHLRIEKRGDTLVIGLKPYRSYNLRSVTMEAQVHIPDLRGIDASGASDVRVSGFSSAKDFDVDLSGASYLDGEITARDMRIEVSGASRVRLRGAAENLYLNASGASNLALEDFPVQDADIELSGASEATVVMNGTLDIDASGASRLYFGGSPTMGRVDLSGASSIKRR